MLHSPLLNLKQIGLPAVVLVDAPCGNCFPLPAPLPLPAPFAWSAAGSVLCLCVGRGLSARVGRGVFPRFVCLKASSLSLFLRRFSAREEGESWSDPGSRGAGCGDGGGAEVCRAGYNSQSPGAVIALLSGKSTSAATALVKRVRRRSVSFNAASKDAFMSEPRFICFATDSLIAVS